MAFPTTCPSVAFGPEFGRRVLVFVDTEEEFDWTQPKRRDCTSVEAMRALPRAHQMLRSFGQKPVYLVDYPIATNAMSVEILRGFLDGDECSIGAQLHAWVNPPFTEAMEPVNSFPGNLPRALEYEKLARLTQAINANFQKAPIVYRAGRYGLGSNSAAIMYELGYRVDVSVRSYYDYRDEGGPDFRFAPVAPFWWEAEKHLLEVPLTATYLGLLRKMGGTIFHRTAGFLKLRSLLARSHLLNRVGLTPEGIPLSEALAAIDVLMGEECRLFSISFHSPSVEPGHTPYVRDAADLKIFYRWWDGVLNHLDRYGVKPVSIEEVLAAAERAR